MSRVRFTAGSANLEKGTLTFALPAGWTCPGAKACLARASRTDGTITDGNKGPDGFRCFAASLEFYPNVRAMRWHNFETLKAAKTTPRMIHVLEASLLEAWGKRGPRGSVRIHASGDFFNQAYFDAWGQVARQYPAVIFYAYTKSLTLWLARAHLLPPNFRLTASEGGKHDALITEHDLPRARVVFSEEEAEGLPIDHDDRHAREANHDFALLIHGNQRKGTRALEALRALKAKGWHGYSRKRKDSNVHA